MSFFDDGNAPHATSGDRSGLAASASAGKMAQMESTLSPPRTSSGSLKLTKNSEKIGRWTEEEHNIFLEGLSKHGKQWKTIANMIGTRTVVQVRTHAQKHYMKLERNKSKLSDSLVSRMEAPGQASNKRKSLSTGMSLDQQRTKKMGKPEHLVRKDSVTKEKSRISISLSNIGAYTSDSFDASTPTGDLLSNKSTFSVSSSSENLSTVSPTGVNELDLGTWGSTDSSSVDLENFYQDCSVDDPLEWFNLDGDMPIFPDFNETLDIPMHLSHSKGDGADPSMPWMDPKITVQSLFIDEHL